MKKVFDNLYVGGVDDKVDEDFCIVHATKTVFDKSKGDYFYETPNEFFLNWVDSRDVKYFECFGHGVDIVNKALDFIDSKIETSKVFIHCDMGQSRSPSLAMMYLAKRQKVLKGDLFIYCYSEFKKMYEDYNCGEGMFDFMNNNWKKIK